MIIQTRYRDVPWEEVAEDYRPEYRQRFEEKWPRRRGIACYIQTPPVILDHLTRRCQGPVYALVDRDGKPILGIHGKPAGVCPHICEIGD